MERKRRRSVDSDWILALKNSQEVRRLCIENGPSTRGSLQINNSSNGHGNVVNKSIKESEQEEGLLREQNDLEQDIEETGMQTEHENLEQDTDDERVEIENTEEAIAKDAISEDEYFQPFDEHYPPQHISSHPERFDASDTESNDSEGSSPEESIPPCAGNLNPSPPNLEEAAQNASQEMRQGEDTVQCNKDGLDFLHRMRRKWESHITLTAMVAVVGSLRYSVQDYEFCRDIVTGEFPGAGVEWPAYSTAQRYFEDVINHCMPRSHLVKLSVKSGNTPPTTGAPPIQFAETKLDETSQMKSEEVRIFLPSTWAKLDVATSIRYNEMYPVDNNDNDCYPHPLEASSAVQRRELYTSACDHIMAPYHGQNVPCGPGSLLNISCRGPKIDFNTPHSISTNEDVHSFAAITTATWCVGARHKPNPSYERALDSLSLRSHEKVILRTLSTADGYDESSDGNDEAADVDDLLYRVLPGDICPLLRSESRNSPDAFQAVVVNRFW